MPSFEDPKTLNVIFRRTKSETPVRAESGATTATAELDVSPLIDAFGQLLAAFNQNAADLPGRPAGDVGQELDPWRMHVLMGRPVGESRGGPIGERNFGGAARAFAEVRRDEKQRIESALAELRDCLWTCVKRVHVAVQADVEADSATSVQMDRVQSAIKGLEAGVVKDEVLQALSSIENISRSRRERQNETFTQLADRVNVLSTELEHARRESETDVLTGLGNRKRLEVAIERAMQLHAISRAPLSLLMMDLDGLKKVNDTLGHPAGDAALASFAGCMAKTFLQDSDELCRIGGDEFVALLPGTKLDLAEKLANRLIQRVNDLPSLDEAAALHIGVSIGFSQMLPNESASAWMSRTDTALYDAKENGRGRAMAG